MIGFKAEMNLHLTVFFIRHKTQTSLSVNKSDITVPKIHALKKQLELEPTKGGNPEASTIYLKYVSNIYEAMIQYLVGM